MGGPPSVDLVIRDGAGVCPRVLLRLSQWWHPRRSTRKRAGVGRPVLIATNHIGDVPCQSRGPIFCLLRTSAGGITDRRVTDFFAMTFRARKLTNALKTPRNGPRELIALVVD